MNGVKRSVFVLAGVALLAGCGGGKGSSSNPPVSAANTLAATPFSVTVGATSGIQSVGITSPLETGSPEHAIPTGGPSAQCVLQGTLSVCSATLTLPAGAQTLGIAVHAATITHSSVHVTLGSARVALAVGGTVAQVSLDLAGSQFAGGTAATATLYVTARDGNGNTIVGSYGGTTIALASSDAAVALSPASVTQSGTNVTASYSGSAAVASTVTLSASAAGVAASAIINATLSFTSSQIIYVAGGPAPEILQFPLNASGNVAPMRRTLISGVAGIFAVAPDGRGNLAFCVQPSPTVPIILPGGSQVFAAALGTIPLPQSDGSAVPTMVPLPLPNLTAVQDCTTDGNGTTFVLFIGNQAGIMAIPGGSATPSRTITGPATGLLPIVTNFGPTTIALGPDGSIFVDALDGAANPEVLVFAPGANGNAAPVRTIAGAATTMSNFGNQTGDAPIAVGPDGSVYVLDIPAGNFTPQIFGDQRVLVFGPAANGNVAPTRIIAGGLTGLSQSTGGVTLAPSNGREGLGLAVDAQGRTYVGSLSSLPNAQILRFDAGANGNVAPSNILGGALAALNPFELRISGGVVAAAPAAGPPSVTGDFLAYAASRGWNYVATPTGSIAAAPPPPFTVTLYADPNPSGSTVQYALFQAAGTPATAISGTLADDATFNNASGYVATGVTSVAGNAFPIPIPGGLTVVPPTLTLGQSYAPYSGLTATVTNVGTVPGSGACPSAGAPGATVTYAFGSSTEVVSYVPGCGITDFITDNGTDFRLTSIASYPQLGTQAVRRSSLGELVARALTDVWKSSFSPWRPNR